MRDKAAVWTKILSSEGKERPEKQNEPPFVEAMLYEAWKVENQSIASPQNASNPFVGELSLLPWNRCGTENQQKDKNFEYSLLLVSPAQANSTLCGNEKDDAGSTGHQSVESRTPESIAANGVVCGSSITSSSIGRDQQRNVIIVWHPLAQCWVCSFTDSDNTPRKVTFSSVVLGYEESKRQAIHLAASSCLSRRGRSGSPNDVIPAVYYDTELREWTATGVLTSDGGHRIEVVQRFFREEMFGGFVESRKRAIQWLISVTSDKRSTEGGDHVSNTSPASGAPRLSEQDRSLLLLFVMLIQQQQKQQHDRQQLQHNDQQHIAQLQQLQQQLASITGKRVESSRIAE